MSDLTHIAEALRGLALPVTDLVLDPANARTHDRRNLDAIKSSLRKFGQRLPIVVQKQGMVVRAGNARLQVARDLGWTHVACVVVDEADVSAVAYALADNRSAELGEWDEQILGQTLASLQKDGWALDTLGWSESDLFLVDAFAESGGIVGNAGFIDADAIPEPPDEAITQSGDLWILGEHRLLCGDSTKVEDVALLMGEERAGLMNTDPPYGISYANDDRPNSGVAKPRVAKPRVANDELSDANLQAFLESAFRAARSSALIDRAAWYLWHAHLTQGFFAAAAAAADVLLHRQIIWVKPVLLFTRGQYHWKHEPCFMGWVRGKQPPDYGRGNGERDQTTVWEIGSVSQQERDEFQHSTPKPVELFAIPIVKHIKPSEIAFEPFAGTGPQFIAAERLGRRCFGLEIEPRYCDVIVARWEKFTGKKSERIAMETAKP